MRITYLLILITILAVFGCSTVNVNQEELGNAECNAAQVLKATKSFENCVANLKDKKDDGARFDCYRTAIINNCDQWIRK